MPFIQFNGKQIPLTAADLTIGAFDGANVRVPGDDPAAHAVLRLAADGSGIIRRGSASSEVMVNGVLLGAEPNPLLHGDKIEVGGSELPYGDDKKGGSTQFISAADIPESLRAKGSAPKKPTTAVGGRLVSLMDGREYTIPDSGVTFGREIGNEIVIASTDVSRKHAQIAPAEGAYVLTDLSTNGVFVNGLRIERSQVLGRGDVLKIGPEEFRFYADVAKAAPVASAPVASAPAASVPPPAPIAPTPVADTVPPVRFSLGMDVIELEDAIVAASMPSAAPPAPVAAPVAKAPAAPTPVAPPAQPVVAAQPTPSAPAAPPIATLEVINEGPMKGRKFEIFSPLTNIGRGAHNDIVISDESLSGSHAKILKRDGAWWVVDQGSTNGTYVGGRRVQGEQQLTGAPDVRFGGIKLIFRPAAASLEDTGGGTRAIAAFSIDAARKAATAPRPSTAASKPDPAAVPAEQKKGCAAMIAFLFALAAIGAGTIAVIMFSVRG